MSDPVYGQAIIGAPGSGKSTYCSAMEEYLKTLKRSAVIINMDPANDYTYYEPLIDIRELVTLEEVMDIKDLGPNGALLFCLEELARNIDWLTEKLKKAISDGFKYFIFDFPGQIELFTHHNSVTHVLHELEVSVNLRLTIVNLLDSFYCIDGSKYIAALLTCLSSMLNMAFPHVNVLSKIDLVKEHGKLQFGLDFYTEVQDLDYLIDVIGKEQMPKYKHVTAALADVVRDYSLVSFLPLSVKDRDTMFRVLSVVDRANGCSYVGMEARDYHGLVSHNMGNDEEDHDFVGTITERYLGDI